MATAYYRKYRGGFKTGYLQKEIILDTPVDADDDISGALQSGLNDLKAHVGDIVQVDGGELVLVVATSATSDAAITDTTISAGMYIIAQSDQSMEYGHIPVENRDYRYSDIVDDKATDKKVAVFKITDVDDIIVTPVSFITA